MEQQMQELWKVVSEHPRWEVSTFGRIRDSKTGAIKYMRIRVGVGTASSYLATRFGKKKREQLVHRLVAEAFLPKIPGNFLVNHKDGDGTNNRIENLEWCTHQENVLHAHVVLGRDAVEGGTPRDIVHAIRASFVRRPYQKGDYSRLARIHGMHATTIKNIHSGKSFGWLPFPNGVLE